MNTHPSGSKTHVSIDYGFVTLQALASTLLGLNRSARAGTLCYAFANQPFAVKQAVQFCVYSQPETPFVPALLVLPWLTGALKQHTCTSVTSLLLLWLTTRSPTMKPMARSASSNTYPELVITLLKKFI